jgi:anti-sigma factor RsiW
MRWFRHPRRALDAYLDGELDEDEAGRVESHLAVCSVCRGRHTVMGQVRSALRSMAARLGH